MNQEKERRNQDKQTACEKHNEEAGASPLQKKNDIKADWAGQDSVTRETYKKNPSIAPKSSIHVVLVTEDDLVLKHALRPSHTCPFDKAIYLQPN